MKSIEEQREDVECMQRHVKTLEHTLWNCNNKLMRMKDELYRDCQHNYLIEDVIWEVEEIRCVRMKCEHCGKIAWKTD